MRVQELGHTGGNYAKRVAAETLGVGGGSKPIGSKGHFEVVWCTTHAKTAGYDSVMASNDANLHKRQWRTRIGS